MAAQAVVAVSTEPTAKLVAGGAVRVFVVVSCDPGDQVLEAHLRVSQDDQTVSGVTGIRGVRCDGKSHKYRVTVSPDGGAFHTGDALASAFVLTCDPTCVTTEQGQEARTITVR